jgi:23S rRNA (uracil1939-C5)-methyltransferase
MAELISGLQIESLDLEARGIAHHQGKVVFVRGALPGETVTARVVRRKPRFDVAEVESIEQSSVTRVAPRCPHFSVCGGCSMQHLEPRAQVSIKQRALEDSLWHLSRVRPDSMLPPIVGPAFGYRYRARLSVRHVPKKGGVLVGFDCKASSDVLPAPSTDGTLLLATPTGCPLLVVPLAGCDGTILGTCCAS